MPWTMLSSMPADLLAAVVSPCENPWGFGVLVLMYLCLYVITHPNRSFLHWALKYFRALTGTNTQANQRSAHGTPRNLAISTALRVPSVEGVSVDQMLSGLRDRCREAWNSAARYQKEAERLALENRNKSAEIANLQRDVAICKSMSRCQGTVHNLWSLMKRYLYPEKECKVIVLPDELVAEVAKALDNREQLDNFSLVCRRFRDVVSSLKGEAYQRPITEIRFGHPSSLSKGSYMFDGWSSGGYRNTPFSDYSSPKGSEYRICASRTYARQIYGGTDSTNVSKTVNAKNAIDAFACLLSLLKNSNIATLDVLDVTLTTDMLSEFRKAVANVTVNALTLSGNTDDSLCADMREALLAVYRVKELRFMGRFVSVLTSQFLSELAYKGTTSIEMKECRGPLMHMQDIGEGIIRFLFRKNSDSVTMRLQTTIVSERFGRGLLEEAMKPYSKNEFNLEFYSQYLLDADIDEEFRLTYGFTEAESGVRYEVRLPGVPKDVFITLQVRPVDSDFGDYHVSFSRAMEKHEETLGEDYEDAFGYAVGPSKCDWTPWNRGKGFRGRRFR